MKETPTLKEEHKAMFLKFCTAIFEELPNSAPTTYKVRKAMEASGGFNANQESIFNKAFGL